VALEDWRPCHGPRDENANLRVLGFAQASHTGSQHDQRDSLGGVPKLFACAVTWVKLGFGPVTAPNPDSSRRSARRARGLAHRQGLWRVGRPRARRLPDASTTTKRSITNHGVLLRDSRSDSPSFARREAVDTAAGQMPVGVAAERVQGRNGPVTGPQPPRNPRARARAGPLARAPRPGRCSWVNFRPSSRSPAQVYATPSGRARSGFDTRSRPCDPDSTCPGCCLAQSPGADRKPPGERDYPEISDRRSRRAPNATTG